MLFQVMIIYLIFTFIIQKKRIPYRFPSLYSISMGCNLIS